MLPLRAIDEKSSARNKTPTFESLVKKVQETPLATAAMANAHDCLLECTLWSQDLENLRWKYFKSFSLYHSASKVRKQSIVLLIFKTTNHNND